MKRLTFSLYVGNYSLYLRTFIVQFITSQGSSHYCISSSLQKISLSETKVPTLNYSTLSRDIHTKFFLKQYLSLFITGKWTEPEAKVFKNVAVSLGVNRNRILLEPNATNTGENVKFSYEVLQHMNLLPKDKIILVQMPYMERRTYATFMKQWPGFCESPDLQVMVTSPPIPMLNYPNTEVGSLRDVISAMMGCLYRIQSYPQKGFQIKQAVPDSVLQSYQKLLSTNMYNDHIHTK